MKVLVAIPCYNCAPQIQRVLNKLAHEWTGDYDVLVLDNGSADQTLARAKESLNSLSFRGNWRLCQNQENYGLGGSQKIAIKTARNEGYDWLIVLHGDDQATPADILKLVRANQLGNKNMLGSRFMRGSILKGYQITRALGNRALNIIFTIICLKKISDLGSGLNLFNVKDLSKIELSELSDSFNFNVDLLLRLIQCGAEVEFSPIHWSETDQVSNARNFKVATSMLKSLLKWRVGVKELHREEAQLVTNLIDSKV